MKTKKKPTLKLVEVEKPYYNSNDCEIAVRTILPRLQKSM